MQRIIVIIYYYSPSFEVPADIFTSLVSEKTRKNISRYIKTSGVVIHFYEIAECCDRGRGGGGILEEYQLCFIVCLPLPPMRNSSTLK